jgi:hypothetical protein
MLCKLNLKQLTPQFSRYPKPLIGDWLVVMSSLVVVIFLFQTLWSTQAASKLNIRQGNQLVGTYDLNQTRDIHIHGTIGDSIVRIEQGKVRFKQSPCTNQYCVHQGWLSRAGQAAICIPNQISLQLIGNRGPAYDSLNY